MLHTLFTGSSGLNNIVDPVRLKYDPDTGVSELAESKNIDIDDTGRVSRRGGQTIMSTAVSHSVFCNKGDCFVMQDRTSDAALYKVGTDFTLSGVRSGMTKGARVSFWQVGAVTYYMNGYESGKITDGISSAWPGFTGHVGSDTMRSFSSVPLGTHICVFQGAMWVAVGDVIYVSEPYAYGKFDLSRRFFQFGADVRMIKPVETGVWVSDNKKTGFIRGSDKFDDMAYDVKSSFPAHEWSECIELADLSNTALQIPGMSALWSSDAGLCVGTENGEILTPTETKLNYPTGAMGATVADKHNIINTIY